MTRLAWAGPIACVIILALTARAASVDALYQVSCCRLFGGPIVPDPELDLPVNPTIEQQVKAGQQLLTRLHDGDLTLDHNQALYDYTNDIIKRLMAAQDIKPPYAIVVHVSTLPELNAYATVGGQMVVYSRIFDQADNEAQLVAILGHELSHEIHNDYVLFWNAAKNGEDSYGRNGLLEQSQAIEQRADLDATRMMYTAGWDPEEQVKMMTRLAKLWRIERENHRVFYSTHPDDPARIEAIRKLIATLPPRANLTTDSQSFEDLKKAMM